MLTRLLICLAVVTATPANAETLQFSAKDGTTITADFQKPAEPTEAIVVLFHMAGASRGEYVEISTVLNERGYATLAIDQRSGGPFNGVDNETRKAFGENPGFEAAIPDLIAAADYARSTLGFETVGVIGSSYSAALVLVLAGRDPGFADAVVSFSPGEYFTDRSLVRSALPGIEVPVFVTSAGNETGQWAAFEPLISAPLTAYRPSGQGRHGATTLISTDASEYWSALNAFLDTHLPAR